MIGVLLLNLGTPEQPTVPAIRRYLKAFLDDPRVIDLPVLIRKLLLYGFILPFRPYRVVKAYQAIWDKDSPLRQHMHAFSEKLQRVLGEGYRVVPAMRQGRPSIKTAVHQLADCETVMILPLFPQYASATTGSCLEAALKLLIQGWNLPNLIVWREFYQDPAFIQVYADLLRKHTPKQVDHWVFSYHGLPEKQVIKSGCDPHCDRLNPCPKTDRVTHCYRAQCFETSRLLADALGLSHRSYSVVFQSRLGRAKWLSPDVVEQLPVFLKRGFRHLAVVAPSFVMDCLETLEEIGLRLHDSWKASGGYSLTLLPCLNDDDGFVQMLAKKVTANTLVSREHLS